MWVHASKMKHPKDHITLNKLFGKRTLFIEAPYLTLDKIILFIEKYKVKRCFCLSPIDYKQSKYPDKTNQKEFELFCDVLYNWLKQEGIKVIPHIHIDKDASFEEIKEKVLDTLHCFRKMGIESDEVYFGWGLKTNSFKRACNTLNLKISKKMFHYYDFWIK